MRAAGLALALTAAAVCAPPLDVPFFRQQKNGCGAASVAMVMHYWSTRTPGAQVSAPDPALVYRDLYKPEENAILLTDMRRYLEDRGFQAFTLRGKWSDVVQHLDRGRPLIAALKPGNAKTMHFAVISGFDDRHVMLNDPTRKKLHRMKRADFDRAWVAADGWLLIAVPRTASE
jgi:predicted double-glycine peptidase